MQKILYFTSFHLSMNISYYMVDAFTKVPFKGNPAGVCLLKEKIEDETLQQVAFEMNLAETAFISLIDDQDNFSSSNSFNLRWFTPRTEIKLCGHATLASAYILFNKMKNNSNEISFHTLSGILKVSREEDLIVMSFPSNVPTKIDPIPEIKQYLSLENQDIIGWSHNSNLSYLLVEVANEEIVRRIKPNFEKLKDFSCDLKILGLCVTAKMSNSKYDFSSRFFAPNLGINEDPVTGSSHTVLVPYWSKKMNKNDFKAIQWSERTGELDLTMKDDRVIIKGNAFVILEGSLFV